MPASESSPRSHATVCPNPRLPPPPFKLLRPPHTLAGLGSGWGREGTLPPSVSDTGGRGKGGGDQRVDWSLAPDTGALAPFSARQGCAALSVLTLGSSQHPQDSTLSKPFRSSWMREGRSKEYLGASAHGVAMCSLQEVVPMLRALCVWAVGVGRTAWGGVKSVDPGQAP